jgi:threonine/homoserine/homoserine lactone efflux protein
MYTGLFTGFVIALPVGPAGLESIRWTLTKNLKSGILVAAGSLVADAIDIMLINFGLLDLIETNKMLEAIFWMLSGLIIIYIGYNAVKSGKKQAKEDESEGKKGPTSRPAFVGFLVNITNPMTHFFWLTLSGTVIRVWNAAGRLPYFIYAVFLLCGMFLGLVSLNYLASKGKKFTVPKLSGKAAGLLAYGITAFGVGFFAYGLYKLFLVMQ